MKKLFLALVFSAFLVLPGAYAAETPAGKPQFHPPQTAAEKALEHILMLDDKDRDFPSFVFKSLERDKSRDKNYSGLFTKELEDAWEKAYLSLPLEDDEGGRDVGYDWIVCGQETSKKYFYATVRSSEYEAYVAVAAPEDINFSPSLDPAPFRMIKEGGKWKLDGVWCAEDPRMNTDFHYTR